MMRNVDCRGNRGFVERKILIISEDLKSFRKYFEKMLEREFRFGYDKKTKSFRKVRPERRDIIIVQVSHVDNNCLKIVQHANSEAKKFYKVYCVFDEVKNQKDISYSKAMSLRIEPDVVRINSAPSYEFWLLLHFSSSTAQYLNNDKLIKTLESLIRKFGRMADFKYDKSQFSDELFDFVSERLSGAIKNAKAIEKSNIKTGSTTPSTKIYQLVEDFQNYF